MPFIKDEVIILKCSKFSESDLIIRSLNKKGSLISFIAKGALKSKKRFAGGVLEPSHFVGVDYKRSLHSSLHFLNQAWFLKRFEGLRTCYDRLNMSLYFLSLVEKISQEGLEDSPDLFNLLGNSLMALETSNDLSALQFVFEARVLLSQGILPKDLQTFKELVNITIEGHEGISSFEKLKPIVRKTLDQYALGI